MIDGPAMRFYGDPPYPVVVIHGGPGAAGEMAPLARRLSVRRGVVEPLQEADSVQGQIEELRTVIKRLGTGARVLVGFSWGAWLAGLTASRFPELAAKLILIGSGPFEQRDAKEIGTTRLKRLTPSEREDIFRWSRILEDEDKKERDRDGVLKQLGALFMRSDAFALMEGEEAGEPLRVNASLHRKVWEEAERMRRNGRLLSEIKKIRCPVVAIHGEYDPHPGRAVRRALAEISADFRYLEIARCGHRPWLEKFARELFFDLLEQEVQSASA